jgi:hypothetical protein
MAAIGNSPTQQAFTPAIDYFSGNGSTTAFTLSRPVASVAQVQVTIDNVAQNPSAAYTVSANTITFTSAPLSGTNNIYVYYTSPITQVIAPGQGTVTATSMASSTGTGAGVFQTSPTLVTPTLGAASATSITVAAGAVGTPSITTTGDTNTGIYFPAADTIAFSEGGAESMRIDSSGNVMVGATSSNYRLRVQGAVTDVGEGDTNVLQGLVSTTAQAAGVGPSLSFVATYDGGSGLAGMGSIAGIKENSTSGNYAGALKFMTRPNGGNLTERMRIDSSGNVLANGTSSADSNAKIQAFSPSGNGAQGWIGSFTGGSGGGRANQNVGYMIGQTDLKIYADWDGSGNPRNKINVSAVSSGVQLTSGATSWAAISDERQKDIIEPITNGLTKVTSLRTVIGKYKIDADDRRRVFLIAQDVQAVLPEAVVIEDEGQETEKLLLSYTDVIPLLVASIKELKAINDTQAETINALTARIVALENR